MSKLEVYDPPMCCSTGVCGPGVDPVLPRFAGDLDWLKSQGVTVTRYNLAQQPGAFAQNELVRNMLKEKGPECLPLILVDGRIVSSAVYPERGNLAYLTGVSVAETEDLWSPAVAELVAIGAAIASNCEPCFKYHYNQARRLGVSKGDMARAVAMGQAVKEAPARSVLELAEEILGITASDEEAGAPAEGTCCGPSSSSSSCCGN